MEAEASVDIGDTDATLSSVVAPNYAGTILKLTSKYILPFGILLFVVSR